MWTALSPGTHCFYLPAPAASGNGRKEEQDEKEFVGLQIMQPRVPGAGRKKKNTYCISYGPSSRLFRPGFMESLFTMELAANESPISSTVFRNLWLDLQN